MNDSEIITKIKDLGPWYHNISLTDKISTMGTGTPARGVNWNRIINTIPSDLSGKRVLDIGCNAGAFSIEAKKRGASFVKGIDYSDRFIKQARFCSEILGLDIVYEKYEAEEYLDYCDEYDIIFFIGILYHCWSPHSLAKKLYKKTKEFCLVETVGASSEFINSEYGIVQHPRPIHINAGSTWINYKAIDDIFVKCAGFSNVEYIFGHNSSKNIHPNCPRICFVVKK